MNIFIFIIGIALSGITALPTRTSSVESLFDTTHSFEITSEDDDLFNDNRRRLLPDLVPQIDQKLDVLFQKDSDYPPGLDVTRLQTCRRKTISNYINLFNTRQLTLNDMLNGVVQGAAICRSKTAQKSGLNIQPLRCKKCIVQDIKNYLTATITEGGEQVLAINTFSAESDTSNTILNLRKVLEVIMKFRTTIYNNTLPTNRVTDFLVVVFKAIVKHQSSISTTVDLYFQKVTKAIETYLWKLQQGEDASSYYTGIFNSIEFYLTRLTSIKVSTEYTETQLVFDMILNELLNFASYRIKGTADYDDTLYLRRILTLVVNFKRTQDNVNDNHILSFLDRIFDAIIYYRDVQTTKALVKETPLGWDSRLVKVVDLIVAYRQNYHFESTNVEQLVQIFTEADAYLKTVSSRRQQVSGSQYVFNQVLNALVHFYSVNQEVINDVRPTLAPHRSSGKEELQYLLELLLNHSYGSLDDEYVFQRRVFELFYKSRTYLNFDSWGNSDVNQTFEVFFKVLHKYVNSKTAVSYGSSQILVIEEIYQVAQRLRFLITQIPKQQEEAWYFHRVVSALISYHSSSHTEVFSTGAEVYINTIYDTVKKYYTNRDIVWEKVILEIVAIYKRSNTNFVAPSLSTSTSEFWMQVFGNIIGNRRGVAEFYLQEIFKVIVSYIDNRSSDHVQVEQVLTICIKYINHRNNHPIVPVVYRPVDQTQVYLQLIEEITAVVTNFNDYDINSVDVEVKYLYHLVYSTHERITNTTALKLFVKLMLKIYQVIKQSSLDVTARTSSLWVFNIIYNQIALIEQNHMPAQVTVFDKILIILQKIVVVQEPSFTRIIETILKHLEDEPNELIERIKVVLNVTSKLYLRIVNVYINRHEKTREWTFVSKMLLKYSYETYGLLLQYVQQKNEIDYTVDVKVVFEAVEHILVNDNAIFKPATEVTEVISILQKLYNDLLLGQLDIHRAYTQIVEIIELVLYGQTMEPPTIEQWVIIIEELMKLFVQDGIDVTIWNDAIWQDLTDVVSGRRQASTTVKAVEIAYKTLSNQLVSPTIDFNTIWAIAQNLIMRWEGASGLISGLNQAWNLVADLNGFGLPQIFGYGTWFENAWTFVLEVFYNNFNFNRIYDWILSVFYIDNVQINWLMDWAYELYRLFYLNDAETLIGKTVITIDQYLADFGGVDVLKKLWRIGGDGVNGDIDLVGGGCNGANGGDSGIIVPVVVDPASYRVRETRSGRLWQK